MDKKMIIKLLQNEDIKIVCGITIRLEFDKPDYIRIDYFNNKMELKNKKYFIKDGEVQANDITN